MAHLPRCEALYAPKGPTYSAQGGSPGNDRSLSSTSKGPAQQNTEAGSLVRFMEMRLDKDKPKAGIMNKITGR